MIQDLRLDALTPRPIAAFSAAPHAEVPSLSGFLGNLLYCAVLNNFGDLDLWLPELLAIFITGFIRPLSADMRPGVLALLTSVPKSNLMIFGMCAFLYRPTTACTMRNKGLQRAGLRLSGL